MSQKQKFIIAGNWKMNPSSLADAKRLFAGYKRLAGRGFPIDLQAYVPAVFLCSLAHNNRQQSVVLGAQNIYIEDQGSYTGAVSVPMVDSVGGTSILIGHSERRNLFGVNNDLVGKKISHAVEHQMPMMVCFGEQERDETGQYTEELRAQLQSIVEPLKKHKKIKLLTLAYEPVWAIGSTATRAVTPDELFSTMLLIRNILTDLVGERQAKSIPIVYGGSVNPDNAGALSRVPGIAGFLIGRASLDVGQLRVICQSI